MNFDTQNLQSENRALKSQIDQFESGEAYTKLGKKHDLEIERLNRAHKKEIKEKDAEIKELRKTVETLKSMYEKSEARIRKMELTLKMNPSQDPLLEEMIREQSEMIENLKKQIDGLSEIITKKDEIIQKQDIQIRKDYTNSSLPSSSDPNHKPIRNGRVKSGRKKRRTEES